MQAFLTTRRGLATGAAMVIGCILAFLFATSPNWRPLLDGTSSSARSEPQPSASGTETPAAVALSSAPSDGVHTSPQAGAAPAAPSVPSPTADAGTMPPSTRDQAAGADPGGAGNTSGDKPSFDIVRIEPTGDSVIAARGIPNADVVLMDGGSVIARAKTDANGQVALLPPPLKAGDHNLMLSMTAPGRSDMVSSQSVVVSVPNQPRTAPMVAMIQPNEPASVLSGPVAGSAPETGAASTMAIRSVEVEDAGSFYASGKATPGRPCRIYLNGSFVATVTPDGNGIWSLQIKRGMKPGRYAVRVDQVELGTGKVVARAEVPFDYPRFSPSSLRKGRKQIAGGGAQSASKASLEAADGPSGTSGTGLAASATVPALTKAGSGAASEAQVASAAGRTGAAGTGAASRSTAAGSSLDPDASTSPTVIPELVTAKVTHGDSLWRISRKMLGHGIRYTQIYAANVQQIRDPKLIYPGQVFVMPQTETQ